MTTAQFNDDINTNSISFVTPITDTTATTTAIESDNNNPILPAVTMTVTEVSITTIFPKQTVVAPSTTSTTSNDASRLFMMKSSQLAAIVVLAYLVFLI
ncbi:hypothetical protein MBANPS3_001597 [Mucor bainieri]